MTLNKKVGLVAALSSMVFVSAVKADDGMKVGGFVDPQLQYTQNVGARVVLNDGAVYLTKSLGDGMAMIDLTFNDLTVNGKADDFQSQAFAAYKYSNGFNWKVGQFDGIFGFERNDTVDVEFANQGLAYALQPKVHQAVLVGYEVSKSMNVQAFVGGSDASGLAGVVGAGNPQIGAKFAYNDGLRLAVGGTMESEKVAADATAMFLNATAGMDFGSLSLDAEYSMDNTGVDGVDATTGVGVYAGYGMTDSTKLGARWTMVGDDMAITVGPNFEMTKDLTVKFDVDYAMNSATDANTAALAVAATYRF